MIWQIYKKETYPDICSVTARYGRGGQGSMILQLQENSARFNQVVSISDNSACPTHDPAAGRSGLMEPRQQSVAIAVGPSERGQEP